MNKVKYPYGACDIQTPDYAATVTLAVVDNFTVAKIALTGALTLKASVSEDVKAGAQLLVVLGSDGTARDTTLSTGFTGANIAGVISKKKSCLFVYDGSTFIAAAAAVQID